MTQDADKYKILREGSSENLQFEMNKLAEQGYVYVVHSFKMAAHGNFSSFVCMMELKDDER